jgi:hypothetical protein
MAPGVLVGHNRGNYFYMEKIFLKSSQNHWVRKAEFYMKVL